MSGMMHVSGPSLARIADEIEETGTRGMAAAEQAIGETVLRLIDETFQKTSAPNGRKWSKRKRAYSWRPLDKTGDMRGGFSFRVASGVVTIDQDEDYFRYQQWGTKTIRPRHMVPTGGMPARWRRPVDEAVRKALIGG